MKLQINLKEAIGNTKNCQLTHFYEGMQNNLFNSEFARNSKFDENFVGNILKIEEWLFLVTQFKNYLEK